MNKYFKRLIIALGIITVVIFSMLVYTIIKAGQTSSKSSLSEYDTLFTKQGHDKLVHFGTETSQIRQPISNYVYDKRFNVFVYKVILVKDTNLKNIITYKNEGLSLFKNGITSPLPSRNFKMNLKDDQSTLVSTVRLISAGDSIVSIIQNDHIFCYYFKFNKFAISYNDEAYDINAAAANSNIPASVVFVKKGKILYVILMTVAEGDEEFDPKLLYNIVQK